jgi:hypothetical protein
MYCIFSCRLRGGHFFKPLVSGASLLSALFTANVQAEEIQFQPAQLLYAGASPLINGKTHAIPCVTDWNGDGRKDLLVGYQTDGKIARIFINAYQLVRQRYGYRARISW